MTNTPTRHIVPAGADAAVRDALQAMVRAHETGRYEPLQAAYMHAKNTLGELAASPASGKVTEADVETAAEALYRCDQDGLRKAASIGMKLVSGAITPWQNLHPENRDGYLIRARAALASIGLEVG